jgi:hypothetical protein
MSDRRAALGCTPSVARTFFSPRGAIEMVDVVHKTTELRDLLESRNFGRGMRVLLLSVKDDALAGELLQWDEHEQFLNPDSPLCRLMEECFEHLERCGLLTVTNDSLIVDFALVCKTRFAVERVHATAKRIEMGQQVTYDMTDLALATLQLFLRL